MTQLSNNRPARLGRVFPERQLSPEEKAQRKAQREEIVQRCEKIFEGLKPEIIKEHYDWFMAIEPDSGDYFIDEDEEIAMQKAREQHPNAWCVLFCINETGACYSV